jgi:hypothetical protein
MEKYVFKPMIEFKIKKGRINMSDSNQKELLRERKQQLIDFVNV